MDENIRIAAKRTAPTKLAIHLAEQAHGLCVELALAARHSHREGGAHSPAEIRIRRGRVVRALERASARYLRRIGYLTVAIPPDV